MPRSRNCGVALLTATCGLLLVAAPARAGSWQNGFSGFGATLQGDLYTPTTPAAAPAVLVAIHMCTGHSTTVHGWFDSYADKQGFYIIAPDAGKQCFDSSATRDGDKAAIVKMVSYLITQKNADKTRVFAAGMSSGGCMTNTLLAIYPDVFAGGSAMPGFPAGAWPAGDIVCSKCGSTPPSLDGTYWANMARKAFTWSGTYPCSQQWVGGGDQYNFNGWLPAVAAQFQTLSSLGAATPATGRSGWTRTVYKDSAGNVRLETNLGPTSQMHDLETVSPTLYGDVITFLGLDKATGSCGIANPGGGTGSGGTGGVTSDGGAATGSGGAGAGVGGGTRGAGGATGGGGMQTGTAGTSGGAGMTGSAGSTGSAGATGAAGSTNTGTGGSTSSGSGGSHSGDNGASGGCAIAGGPRGGGVALLLLVALSVGARRRSRAGK